MSTIKVDTITDEVGSGAPDFPNGMTGSGASLTGIATAAQGALAATALQSSSSLPAANLTGTLPAIDGSALTGVGGATSVITARTAFTSTAALTLSLPTEYDVICIDLYDVKHTMVSAVERIFNMRLGDASSTTITGSEYLYMQEQPISGFAPKLEKSNQILANELVAQASSGGFLMGQVFIYNANKSDVITTIDSKIMSMKQDEPWCMARNLCVMRYAETNANASFYFTLNEGDSTVNGNAYGYYKVWGIKL